MTSNQKELSPDQISAFYHSEFVEDQVRDFAALVSPSLPDKGIVADIGGGCGYFALRLARDIGVTARVIDTDPVSVDVCRNAGLLAEQGDALCPVVHGDERAASFNLVLHHLVASSEGETRRLQMQALTAWRSSCECLFVNEYIYESFFRNFSGWLIYHITASSLLSSLGRMAARLVPSFRANTFGVGVRFRSHAEWVELFLEAGYRVSAVRTGAPEKVAIPLRLLLIRSIRRDSFLLVRT